MSCTRVAKFLRRLLTKPCGVMPLRRAWVNESCVPLISSQDIRTDKVVDHHSRNGDCGTDRFGHDVFGNDGIGKDGNGTNECNLTNTSAFKLAQGILWDQPTQERNDPAP